MQTERSDERRALSVILAESIRRQPNRTAEEWAAIDGIIAGIDDSDPHKVDVRAARMEVVRRALQ